MFLKKEKEINTYKNEKEKNSNIKVYYNFT